jgi:hypothetical protein
MKGCKPSLEPWDIWLALIQSLPSVVYHGGWPKPKRFDERLDCPAGVIGESSRFVADNGCGMKQMHALPKKWGLPGFLDPETAAFPSLEYSPISAIQNFNSNHEIFSGNATPMGVPYP